MTSTTRTRARRNGEGTVRPHPKGGWQARYYDHDGVRRQLYARTEADALAKLAEARVERAQGLPAADRSKTVRSWIAEYLDTVAAPKVRPQTLAAYRVMGRRISADEIGRRKLVDLSPGHVRAAMLRFHDPKGRHALSASTVRLHHVFLRTVLRQAMRDGLLHRNVADVGRLPGVTSERELPAPGEIARLRAAIARDELAAAYLLGIRCGLRIGEIGGLQWGDVKLAVGTLQVRRQLLNDGRIGEPKSATSARLLPIPADVIAALGELARRTYPVGVSPMPSAWVFQSETRPGKPRGTRTLQERWSTLQRRSGLAPVGFHTLRHIAAHELLRTSSAAAVSKYLGHASIGITVNLYGHAEAAHVTFAPAPESSATG